MSTDFRSGKEFPRRGRTTYGGYLWLLRAFDKARAAAAGTLFDYIYPCPMDRGVMERWGISPAEFDAAVAEHHTDEAIIAWLLANTATSQRDAANRWLLEEKTSNLDRQDAEEGAVVG